MKTEYLIFNLLILFFPILGIFFYKKGFWPKLKPALLAALAISSPYIIWDQLVAGNWWSFNSKYILDWKIGNLPVEEILFFFVIPWSCLVIWENLKRKIHGEWKVNIEGVIILMSVILGIWAFVATKWYSLAVCIVMLLISSLSMKWLRAKSLSVFLGLVFVLTLIFNGYLTARPIVIYNPQVISGIHFFTIPVEDVLYGLALITGIVILYENFSYTEMNASSIKKNTQ